MKLKSETGAATFVMLELTLTSQIIAGLSFLALAGAGYIYYQQKKELARKRDELKAQKFANKRSRIIREIASRLAAHKAQLPEMQNPQPILNPPEGRGAIQQTPVSLILPGTTLADQPEKKLETKNQEGGKQARADLTKEEMAPSIQPKGVPPQMPHYDSAVNDQPIELTEAPPPANPTAIPPINSKQNHQPSTSPNTGSIASSRTKPRAIETSKGQVLTFQNIKGPDLQRGQRNKSDFYLNLEDSIYQQIKDYAHWVANQSDLFTIEVHQNNKPVETISLVFDDEDLKQRNGHLFDLFRPPDLGALTLQANTQEGTIHCQFNQQAIEQLSAPAVQILNRAKQEGTPRYEQVIKETALSEFIDFMSELNNIMATDPAE